MTRERINPVVMPSLNMNMKEICIVSMSFNLVTEAVWVKELSRARLIFAVDLLTCNRRLGEICLS